MLIRKPGMLTTDRFLNLIVDTILGNESGENLKKVFRLCEKFEMEFILRRPEQLHPTS